MKRGSFPIRGVQVGEEDYKQNEKDYDENKCLYHQNLVVCINDLDAYNRLCKEFSPMDVLTLEGVGLVSTKAILAGTGIALCHIDIVSKNVKFEITKKNAKTGVLFFGELYDYLMSKDVRPHVYDIVICDFCATWATQKECVKLLFDKQLLDEVSFLTITCSKRKGVTSSFQFEDEATCRADIQMWADGNGYEAVASPNLFHYDNMYCLFYKVIHLKSTMNYKDGIRCKVTPYKWLHTPFDIQSPPE